MEQITMEQLAEHLKVQIVGQARMEANQAESKAKRKAEKEESMAKMERLLADNREMKATIRSGQE
jgi:FAD synthase